MNILRKFPVSEIFGPVIMGEGILAGQRGTFIRFAGCDSRCTWCLGPNTLITMASGRKKKIRDIVVGDVLVGYDEKTKTLQPTTVKATASHEAETLWSIKYPGGTVVTTAEHQWYTARGWVRTDELVPGEEIYNTADFDIVRWKMRNSNPVGCVSSEVLSARAKQIFTGRRHTPDHRRKNGEAKRLRNPMKNPEVSRRNAESHDYRQTQGELLVEGICTTLGIPFRYSAGKGKRAIGSKESGYRFPDFTHTTEKKVIEVYSGTFRYGGTPHRPTPHYRDESWVKDTVGFYLSHGYKCLCIDSDKPNREEIIRQLLTFAMNGLPVKRVGPMSVKGNGPTRQNKTVYDISCFPHSTFFANTLLCHNCDTPYSVLPQLIQADEQKRDMDAGEILRELQDRVRPQIYSREWVNLTGGNPCIHDLSPLFRTSYVTGAPHSFSEQTRPYLVNVETQGTQWQEWVNLVDLITLSPKGPSSGNVVEQGAVYKFLKRLTGPVSVNVKIVVQTPEDYAYAVEMIRYINGESDILDIQGELTYSLTPCTPTHASSLSHGQLRTAIVDKTAWLWGLVSRDRELPPGVRVIPQLHTIVYGTRRGV